MLSKIKPNSPQLCSFLDPLMKSLSQPQRRHLQDLCDALLVCESEHTIAGLQRQFVETTDASNWADFLGEKDKAIWRLEAVDFHHDHNVSKPGQDRYKNGFCYLASRMCVFTCGRGLLAQSIGTGRRKIARTFTARIQLRARCCSVSPHYSRRDGQ